MIEVEGNLRFLDQQGQFSVPILVHTPYPELPTTKLYMPLESGDTLEVYELDDIKTLAWRGVVQVVAGSMDVMHPLNGFRFEEAPIAQWSKWFHYKYPAKVTR